MCFSICKPCGGRSIILAVGGLELHQQPLSVRVRFMVRFEMASYLSNQRADKTSLQRNNTSCTCIKSTTNCMILRPELAPPLTLSAHVLQPVLLRDDQHKSTPFPGVSSAPSLASTFPSSLPVTFLILWRSGGPFLLRSSCSQVYTIIPSDTLLHSGPSCPSRGKTASMGLIPRTVSTSRKPTPTVTSQRRLMLPGTFLMAIMMPYLVKL